MRPEYTCVLDMCLPPKKDIRTSEETTNLIMHDVFRHHSLPDNIINDHGPQFISKFWKHFFTMLKVFCKLSSGYHPQTNGQTECTNQTLE